MTNKTVLLFSIIIALAAFLRLWQLGNVPNGFYSDEALYGYEAYSLLKTGKDQFGNVLPLSIAGFGDYRPALYIYSTIPFVKIFGLSELATRLPSAVFSIMTVGVLFLFVKNVFGSTKIASLSALLLTLSPWSLYFGRMAHETNLMTLLILIGTYILWKYRGDMWGTITKIFFFAAAMYTYHTARVYVPLFLIYTVILFRKQVRKHSKLFLVGLLLFLVTLLPLITEFSGEGFSRVKNTSFWNDPGLIPKINELRGAAIANGTPAWVGKLLYNKGTIYPVTFLDNFFRHFTASFLLTKGDPNGIYNVPNTGILLWIELPLLLIGYFFLWKKRRPFFWWFLGMMIIGLIPDSLTRLSPSSARIHVIVPYVSLLSGIGVYYLLKIKHKFVFSTTVIVVTGLLVLNQLWFWHQYLVVLPVQNQRAWQIGTKELIQKTVALATDYDQVWMSRECWGWIHLVFYAKYDPTILQKEITHSPRNDLGFWWVSDIGKYHLDYFPTVLKTDKKRLYVGIPKEFPLGTKALGSIKHPVTQEELFLIVDGRQFQTVEIAPKDTEFNPDEGYL